MGKATTTNDLPSHNDEVIALVARLREIAPQALNPLFMAEYPCAPGDLLPGRETTAGAFGQLETEVLADLILAASQEAGRWVDIDLAEARNANPYATWKSRTHPRDALSFTWRDPGTGGRLGLSPSGVAHLLKLQERAGTSS